MGKPIEFTGKDGHVVRAIIASPDEVAALEAAQAAASQPSAVRKRAALRVVAWGIATVALTAFVVWYRFYSESGGTIVLVGAGLPGAMLLVNLLELASGVPMAAWERRWASLSGARKLAMTIAVVCATLAFFAMVTVVLAASGAL